MHSKLLKKKAAILPRNSISTSFIITVQAALLYCVLFGVDVVHALSVEDPSHTLGLGSADLLEVGIRGIRWVLGLIGIIAVIMVLLGGFKWMLSAGNEERVAEARRTISSALAGLILILLAWAIVGFVINTTLNVTGGASAPVP